MILYVAIVAIGLFAGYYGAASYGGQVTGSVGDKVRKIELDALGLLDDSPSDSNDSSAGAP